MVRAALVALAISAAACGGGYSPTQADPANDNQAYMLSEVRRIERLMDIGQFIVTFEKPPAQTYAGWANCNPNKRPPFSIGFNESYIAQTLTTQYMSALVAHEMCHHYVAVKGGSCWDEKAAEECAARYY